MKISNKNVKLWGSSSAPRCGYAEDLILFIVDIHSRHRATNILGEAFTNGLCIDVSKTETMILNHMLLEYEYPDTIISLRNVQLQNSTEFKYLGSYISQNEPSTGDIQINHRIQIAYIKFVTMTTSFKNYKITLKPGSSF